MGKTTVAKHLKRRKTFINKRGEIVSREGFDDETKKERLERKQKERAIRFGLKPKDDK